MDKRWKVRKAVDADSDNILEFWDSVSMQGMVQLLFKRSPNFFHAARVASPNPDVWLVETVDTDRIIAILCVGKRKTYIDGVLGDAYYVCDARVAPDFRGSGLLKDFLPEIRATMDVDLLGIGVCLKENVASLKAFASGKYNFYKMQEWAQYYTCVISTRHLPKLPSLPAGHTLRFANANDVPVMQAFYDRLAQQHQFCLHTDFQGIVDGDSYYRNLNIEDFALYFVDNKLKGMLAYWNQKQFKQTCVMSYPFYIKMALPLYNLWAKYAGGFILPPAGEQIRFAPMFSLMVEDRDIDISRALFLAICKLAAERDEHTLVVSLDKADVRLAALKGFRFRKMESYLFLKDFNDTHMGQHNTDMPYYVEVARL